MGSNLQVNEEETEADETEENLPRVEDEVFVTKETIQSTYSDLLKGYTYEYDENGVMIRMSNYRLDTCEVIEWIEYEYFIVPKN